MVLQVCCGEPSGIVGEAARGIPNGVFDGVLPAGDLGPSRGCGNCICSSCRWKVIECRKADEGMSIHPLALVR